MVLNICFMTENGKKSVAQLQDDFDYKNFMEMIDKTLGVNTIEHFTLVAKGKDLCVHNETQFNDRKNLIVNGVNIFVGRRMIGGNALGACGGP
ncbi:unnamed protein product [Didymodactylos carnosus]|uniref:Uncharacterized protein n=1 Tax=Didymodactylos carnosus TaxID=1234261 RepID=A0A8S2I9H4_9BILA|nr:unnamed protein product [Didymodactylos carnosus]CAF3729118.1 unnamed protein product [Didymodactylos carnosus]